jgi:hypothetical protein
MCCKGVLRLGLGMLGEQGAQVRMVFFRAESGGVVLWE